MSANGNKSVRFSEDTDRNDREGPQSRIAGASAPEANSSKKRKRPAATGNVDELDDIDEWKVEIDGDEEDRENPYAQHELLRVKRERRQRQLHDDDDDDNDGQSHNKNTTIDDKTSLAAEGIAIEPFHMDQERTDGTGYFDGDTYVFRRKQEEEETDAWLEELDDQNDQDETRSIKNQDRAAAEQRRKEAQEEEQMSSIDNWTEKDLLAKILPNLTHNETVLEGLRRYGSLLKTEKGESRQLAQDSFNDLTEASNALLLKGKMDIYQMSRSEMESILEPIPSAPSQATAAAAEVQWEYKGNLDGKIHGRYSTHEMLVWIQNGYFCGSNAVQIRSVAAAAAATESGGAAMKNDLLSDLLDDNDGADNDGEVVPQKDRAVEYGEWMQSDQVDFQKYLR